MLIGAEDRGRNVHGVADPLDEEERLANPISNRISPRLMPKLEILPWRQTQVLALQVYPSSSRPQYMVRRGLPMACMCGWAPPTTAPMQS
ncbi:MAG: ATP-binding protein [Aphanothece saxicola GSE-SYN-MK-01-06B]|nr:ATP-binding protein [Aphanothece saxicola GSE-SYN-MK-01-06B]